MNALQKTFGVAGLAVAVGVSLMLAASAPALADTPTVTLNSPTGGSTIFLPAFPSTTSIAFGIVHSPLQNLVNLDVQVDATSLTSFPVATPFENVAGTRFCTAALIAATTACNTSGIDTASAAVNWQIPAPGTYAILVKVTHGPGTGTDAEEVSYALELVNVEYPAPPAVANAYINQTYSRLSGGIRGCIISQIANEHAVNEKYGPKGGPYNDALIQSDVVAFKLSCS